MSQVLFTHSYFYRLDKKQWRFKQPYPPLATIQAASVIREAGLTIALFDTCLETSPARITQYLQKERPQYVVIYDDGFNYLTKMCLTVMREASFELARRSKKFGCTVIVSSPDAADHHEKYLLNNVDFVIRGEGERTLKELLVCLEKRGDPSLVPGLVFKRSGVAFHSDHRIVERKLDSFPLPAWDLIDITAYRKIWLRHHGYFSLNIATTRGCPFKCNWCAKPIYGNRYNARSPEHVVNEIEFLISNYQPDHFWFCDDIFGLKPGWIHRFSEILALKKIKIRYKIQARADLLLDGNTIEALAGSGAETVWIGAESGAQKVLDAMEKGITVPQIHEATKRLKENNIDVGFFLQFGYPGESSEDIRSTIKMLLDLMPQEVGISVSYPLPGTKFFDSVKTELASKQNWKDSDDLDLMFHSAFNREYYRQLHRYVHSVHRKKMGYMVLKKLFNDPLRLTPRDFRSVLATFYYLPSSFARSLRLRKLETANADSSGEL